MSQSSGNPYGTGPYGQRQSGRSSYPSQQRGFREHGHSYTEDAYGGISGGIGGSGGGSGKWIFPIICIAVVVVVLGVILAAGNLDLGADDDPAADVADRGEQQPATGEGAGALPEESAEEQEEPGGESALDGLYDLSEDDYAVLGDGDFVVRYLAVTTGDEMNVTYPTFGTGVEQELDVSSPWALELRGETYDDILGSNLIVSPVGADAVGCRMYYDGELVAEDAVGADEQSAHCTIDWYASAPA